MSVRGHTPRFLGRSDVAWRWDGYLKSVALGAGGHVLAATCARAVAACLRAAPPPTHGSNAASAGGSGRSAAETPTHSSPPAASIARGDGDVRGGEERGGEGKKGGGVSRSEEFGVEVGEWKTRVVASLADPLQVAVMERRRGGGGGGADTGDAAAVCVAQVSAGERHVLVLLSNGTVLSFAHPPPVMEEGAGDGGGAGAGGEGEGGGGAGGGGGSGNSKGAHSKPAARASRRKVDFSSGAAVVGLDDKEIIAVSAGTRHSLAVSRSGCVWGWGSNVAGQLGDGTLINSPSLPVQVLRIGPAHSKEKGGAGGVIGVTGGGSGGGRGGRAVEVAAGGAHSVALLEDGCVMTWGCDNCGQLGSGARVGGAGGVRLLAAVVAAIARVPVVQVAAGAFHTLALSASGDVYAWGYNAYGQGTQFTCFAGTNARILTQPARRCC